MSRARFGQITVLIATLALLAISPLALATADPNKVLRVAFEIGETGFDPAKVSDDYSSQVIQGIFESLLTYDYLARPLKLVPGTAESMPEIADGGRSYLFHLRKGIYVHTDPAFKGLRRELTASDYAFAIKRFVDPANRSPWRFLVDGKIVGLADVAKRATDRKRFDYDAKIAGLEMVDRYPQVKGYRYHPMLTAAWEYLDLDPAARRQ